MSHELSSHGKKQDQAAKNDHFQIFSLGASGVLEVSMRFVIWDAGFVSARDLLKNDVSMRVTEHVKYVNP